MADEGAGASGEAQGAAGAGAGGGGDEAARGHVPASRFAEVVGQKNAAEAAATEARALAAAAEAKAQEAAAAVAAATAERARLTAERDAQAATWAEERALLRHGLHDDDAQAVARALYARVPEASRPQGGLDGWLASLRADPATAPRALQPYLGGAAAPPPAAAAGVGAPSADAAAMAAARAASEAANGRRAGQPPADGPEVTHEQLNAETARAAATGDWSRVKVLRDQLIATLKRPSQT
jgi:hypothetical protein